MRLKFGGKLLLVTFQTFDTRIAETVSVKGVTISRKDDAVRVNFPGVARAIPLLLPYAARAGGEIASG